MEEKKLGLGSGIAVCMGLIVATSCLVSLGNGFGYAGGGFIISMVIVVFLNAFVALSFAEMNRMMPSVTGGLGQYTLVGLGPWASIVSNLSAYAITNVFATSVELTMCGMVLADLFGLGGMWNAVFAIIVLLVLFALNLRGIDIFAKVQNITVILLIGSMLALGVVGLLKLGNPASLVAEAEKAAPVGFGGAISLSALAFWLFIGVEFIIPVAKHMKNPKKNVPLAMILALLILLAVQSVLGSAFMNYVPAATLASPDVLPHIVFAEAMLGEAGYIWMSLVTL
ncbi:MAG: amino acid permease, partial [Gracilibacteraceae bacterium]|nr:amino acid permease [Gracilibacteraceae bacterium]